MKYEMQARLIGWALAVALCAPLALNAQEEAQTPPPLADLWVVHVKAGHEGEFEAQFKAHLGVRKQAGDPRAWRVYTPVIGDDMGYYSVRFCCSDWAEQDTYEAWSLNNAGVQEHWNEHVHPHVASYEHYLQVTDHDNNHWPAEDPGFKYFGVTEWKTKPGGYAAMDAARVAMSKMAKEHNWSRYWAWLTPVGGSGGLELVSPYLNYAGMAPPEPGFGAFAAKHMGAEKAAETMAAFSGNLGHSKYTVYRLREDLSTYAE